MANENDILRQDVLNKTLEEVEASIKTKDLEADPCVICLDAISEKAIAYPCKHASFDFLCLISWLQEKDTCPLCKVVVKNVNYNLQSHSGPKRYELSKISKATSRQARRRTPTARGRYRPQPRAGRERIHPSHEIDDALARRRHIYRNKLFALHVGSNRISHYQDLTPESFGKNERLMGRAKAWIRRELQVFDFLNPDSARYGTTERRANNAEFLLEYIVAILRTVDIKGSGGQAEDLITDFLGREHTQLFLHELQAWLRSPYEKLEDWDRAVQYTK